MKSRGYTIYAVLTSLLWEAILVVVVLKVLPGQGIDIPLWALIVLMAVLGACFFTTYWLGKTALNKTPSVSLQTLIGTKGKTTTMLEPRGYVRIGNELWQAKAESDISGGVEVTVVGVEGMTLLVRPASGSPTSKKKLSSSYLPK
ncbi:MAG: NfeD family protein [Chloroflexota bacterium]|nr:NfeD family protein [Chloroflexota bacterium]